MNTLTDEQLERIEQYLMQELDAEERAQIKTLITEDPAWKREYDLRIAAREVSRKYFHQSMRRSFDNIDRTSGKRSLNPLWLLAAACVAIVISAMLWLFPARQTENLFAEYRAFPNIVLPIEKSGGEYSIRERAYQAYELGEYTQAIAFFSQLDSVVTADRLYLGLSLLESGSYREALPLFDEVRASSNTRWSEVADWYQMWAYLRQDNRKEANRILLQIARSPGHRYLEEAKTLQVLLKG